MKLKHEKAFSEEREIWIQKIISDNIEITKAQVNHLEKQNKRLNLAIRLVEPFQKDSGIWTLQPKKQVIEIVGAVQRLKPLIDFLSERRNDYANNCEVLWNSDQNVLKRTWSPTFSRHLWGVQRSI